jgi:N-acetylneuraminic acid mutarotase
MWIKPVQSVSPSMFQGIHALHSPGERPGPKAAAKSKCKTGNLGIFLLALISLGLHSSAVNAQTNEWTWMGGNITAGGFGVYGTIGTPAAENIPGGRSQPVSWVDSKGNFWLFGGLGFDANRQTGFLNDLWQFDPSTNEWKWMAGNSTVPSSFGYPPGVYGTLGEPAGDNVPSGRSSAVSWTDAKGNLWLFGGTDFDSNGEPRYLNDLWEFNPSTNQWTWISGSATANQSGLYGTLGTAAPGNVPGSRDNAVSWTDSKGNLWMFGGAGYDSAGNQGNLNDLWKFSPTTNQWTWISGSDAMNQLAVPGTLQKAAAGNVPAARNGAVSWVDHNGNFWLFGGVGVENPSEALGSYLNDLWEFNPTSGEWAWMGGTAATVTYTISQPGIYGTLQVPATGNVPGTRTGAVGWTDSKGNLWMFGGTGYDSSNTQGLLNDLWEFNPSRNEWAWMGGSASVTANCFTIDDLCGQPGVYGKLTVQAFGNTPGGRYFSVGWLDSKGNFWLLGGNGFDFKDNRGYLNDLWEFQPNTNGGLPITATPSFTPNSGTYSTWQTVTITDTTPGATINYLVNGNTPLATYSGPITISSSETIEAIATATGYANSGIATANYTADFSTAAAPTFSVPLGNYASSQTVTISDVTPGAKIYYAIGSTYTTAFSVYSGPITVSSTETLQAYAVAEDYLNSGVVTAAYNIGKNASGQWTWMGGSNLIPAGCSDKGGCGAAGWYGTLRVPAPSNFPGARSGASTWTDSQGNFWLFGGLGYDSAGNLVGNLNDLWEFHPATGEWTWMAGSKAICGSTGCGLAGVYGTLGTASVGNVPGGRSGAATWTDSKGNLWLFAGYGIDGAGSLGYLNDVWKFDPSTNDWTWMGGSSAVPCLYCGQPGQYGTFGSPAPENIPGGRSGPTEWADHNGNVWIFGGLGYDSRGIQSYLNDLWEFNPSTNEWTWMGGSQFGSNYDAGLPGLYGTLDVPGIENIPWSLINPARWTDNNGNLWLFGGIGEDTTSTGYYLNDMWEFNPSLNEWAWTSANSVSGGGSAIGVYGTLGDFSPANIPGERNESATWTDGNGNFWLLGGTGAENSDLELGWLNDLWEFNPSINQWRWMSGSNSIPFDSFGTGGQYGTLGTPALGNTPGGRYSAATWRDASGNLWLFGGSAFDAHGTQGLLNDLWEYTLAGTPVVPPPTPSASPTFSLPAGAYTSAQTLTISDQTSGSTIYYTTNGTAPNTSSAIYSTPITVSSSETVEAVGLAGGHAVSSIASAAYAINLPAAATPMFSVPGGTYTAAQTVTISDATSNATIYFTTDGTTPSASSTVYTGPITVSTTETIEAVAVAVARGYADSAVASAMYTINPPPTFTLATSPASLTVISGSNGTVNLTVTPQNGFNSLVSFACLGLPSGASCSFNPTTVTPVGSAVIAQVTISTAKQSATSRPASGPLFPATAMAAILCLFGWRKRRGTPLMMLVVLAIIGLGFIFGCGGGTGGSGSGTSPPPVTSTVTVTASSGALQQTATISLTVD